MNVADLMISSGADTAVAVVHRDAVLTYAQLRQRVTRLAGGLVAHGHKKGERIGIWSENSPFFVTAYLGTIRAGLVAVPFQTDLQPGTFAKIVADAEIKTILVSQRFVNRLQP